MMTPPTTPLLSLLMRVILVVVMGLLLNFLPPSPALLASAAWIPSSPSPPSFAPQPLRRQQSNIRTARLGRTRIRHPATVRRPFSSSSSASSVDTLAASPASSAVEEQIRIGRDRLARYFDFELDDWQLQAGGAVVQGHHVVVCAPTGAGKTVVGEMALLNAYHHGGDSGRSHSVYTTPLKALSNQKYADLCSVFGRNHTGLATGDVSINKENARVTVMTTEVYRNLAWRWQSDDAKATTSATAVGGRKDRSLRDTAVVVLDEFHYMGYPGRGGVWEESVITSPPHVQIVALSATLPNADELARWIGDATRRQVTVVDVPASMRPVPLRYLYATKDGLFPLFRDVDAGPGAPRGLLGYRGDGAATAKKGAGSTRGGFLDGGKDSAASSGAQERMPRGLQINPALKAATEKRMQRVNRALERNRVQQQRGRYSDFDVDDDWNLSSGGGRRKRPLLYGNLSPREERRERERLLRREMRRAVPSLSVVVERLQQKQLLPAIFFIFSRAGCEDAARTLYQQRKGPRHDVSKLLPAELDEFQEALESTDNEGGGGQRDRQKRKTRSRGKRRGEYIEDSEGRSFRSSSNYISEDLLQSLYQPDGGLLDEGYFNDASSPLSSSNWDFYSRAGLLDYAQVKDVATRISLFNNDNPEIAFDDDVIEQYLFGVGCHHAGMLPAHKSFVEVLYRNQLMKVVFATETLAAGINMPARTTVVCSLAKRGDGNSMQLLETSNLLQMAGRAGRRGMDTDGTCVIVATPFEGQDDAAKILTDPIKPIKSQFSPSYSLAVNLVARGEGKLDVARQLVGKSFAMWEKRQVENSIDDAIECHGEGVSEVLRATAQEKFMNTVIDTLELQVEKRRAKFDIARIESLLGMLKDRELLKKTSKSYLGAAKMLELERTTLGYLEMELETLRAASSEEDRAILGELFGEDEKNLLEQIDLQRKRAVASEKEVGKHPLSAICSIVNEIMREDTPEAKVLEDALKKAREGGEDIPESKDLTASELSKFSKSAIVVRRKTRKLANSGSDIDPASLVEQAISAEIALSNSWDDMRAIIKTLLAYGCLSTDGPFPSDDSLEDQVYTLTPAGMNLGMLGFENSLWCLAAVGGAFDVVAASSKLDEFRSAMDAFDDDDDDDGSTDWYEGSSSACESPKAQQEAETLVSQLQQLTSSELAGYVSSLVSESPRLGAPSVVELFQRLTTPQQRVIQTSLLVMERLTEVQKEFNVDEKTRSCNLDVCNCEVVTAWAGGCTWNEALQISGLPPGDLARILSRALDAVRQLGNLPYAAIRRDDLLDDGTARTVSPGIHPEVRQLCREAAWSINRYPVKDPLAFGSPEEDEEDVEDEVMEEDVFDDIGDEESVEDES